MKVEQQGYVVIANQLTKKYSLYKNQKEILKSLFSIGKQVSKEYIALKDINFKVRKGEIIGIVGLNGSGKTTLSTLIAQISVPTYGSLKVIGSVAMLSAQSGLNPNLTGVQNIEYKCILMGLSKEQIANIKGKIIDFADIGEFINQPLKTYSSGMKARLGFAISVYIDPDILIIDEGLAVGDTSFTDKCFNKIEEFRRSGKTIFYISHMTNSMKDFCDRVMWLHKGSFIGMGETEEILSEYTEFVKEYNKLSPTEKQEVIPEIKPFEYKQLPVDWHNDRECTVEISTSKKERCQYMFRVYKEQELLYDTGYSSQNKFTYVFENKGNYKIRYFIKYGKENHKDYIMWENGKKQYCLKEERIKLNGEGK